MPPLVQVERRDADASATQHHRRWALPESAFFSRRKQECESKDFGDGLDEYLRQFDTDWSRVVSKQRFLKLICATDRGTLRADRQELERGASCIHEAGFATAVSTLVISFPWSFTAAAFAPPAHFLLQHFTTCMTRSCCAAETNEVKEALGKHCVALALIFSYFANEPGSFTSADMHSMRLEHFRKFVQHTVIISPRGKALRTMNELDACFVVRSCSSCMLQNRQLGPSNAWTELSRVPARLSFTAAYSARMHHHRTEVDSPSSGVSTGGQL